MQTLSSRGASMTWAWVQRPLAQCSTWAHRPSLHRPTTLCSWRLYASKSGTLPPDRPVNLPSSSVPCRSVCVGTSLYCRIIHLFDRQVMPVLVNVNGNWVLVYRPFQNPLIVCFWPHDPAWLLPFHPLVSSFHSFSPPLQALSDRFCGEILDDKIPLYSFFPDEYFTCSSVCLSCK